MKKIFSFMLIFTAGLILVGCTTTTLGTTATGEPTTARPTKPTVNCAVNPEHESCQTSGTTAGQAEVDINPKKLKAKDGAVVTILSGAPNEIDPFHETFSGDRKAEKQALQLKIQQSYNVTIEYKLYGDDAAWGDTRVNAIINGVATSKPIGEVYFIDSSWLPKLQRGGAVAPIGSYMQDREFSLNRAYEQAMTIKERIYGISTGRAENLDGLYFNQDLLESLELDNPADLFMQDKWTFDTFFKFLADAKAVLGSKFAIGGFPQDYAFGFTASLGGQFVSPATNDVLINSDKVVQAYEYVRQLKPFYEPSSPSDAGTEDWKQGNVLFNYGTFWFLKASTRWADLGFKVGYVPFPVANGKTANDYMGAFSSDGVFAISEGYDNNNIEGLTSEIIYNVLQDTLTGLPSLVEYEEAFRNRISDSFNLPIYTDVFIKIQGESKIYCEQVKNLGINLYDAINGLAAFANKALNGTDDIKSSLDALKPVYDRAKTELFG